MNVARLLPLVLGLAVSVGSVVVGAQTPPGAVARRQLVERALAAREADDHAGALDLFIQAGELLMRPGLRMSIAQEQQALGRRVEACESASECVAEVQADLASPGSARVMSGCAELVSWACAALGRVQVRAPTPVPAGLRVEVQRSVVNVASGLATVHVEPGVATVRTTLPGRAAITQSVTVRQGETASVTLDLTRHTVPTTAPAPVDPPAPASTSVTATHSGVTSEWWFWTGLSVVVVGGILGGLAAGGVFDMLPSPIEGNARTINTISVY